VIVPWKVPTLSWKGTRARSATGIVDCGFGSASESAKVTDSLRSPATDGVRTVMRKLPV
jgi:hypothetical protein